MSDRLNNLQKQKQLIQDHLHWLDQEILAESGKTGGSSTAAPQAVPALQPSPPPEVSGQTEAVPATSPSAPDEKVLEKISEDLISKYSRDTGRKEMNPKLGCVLYFAGALGFIVAVVYAIYWFGYR